VANIPRGLTGITALQQAPPPRRVHTPGLAVGNPSVGVLSVSGNCLILQSLNNNMQTCSATPQASAALPQSSAAKQQSPAATLAM